jgi:hypothetical protein
MRGKIFINYRRGDEPGFTQALLSRLEEAFPAEGLFIDVDNIPPGEDFVRLLDTQVAQCDVLLAVIGNSWLDATDEHGGRRLDDPRDFVRIEIESALKQGKRVIPVLMHKARMPRREELPETLWPLAARNAVRLTHERFKADVEGLVKALQEVGKPPRFRQSLRRAMLILSQISKEGEQLLPPKSTRGAEQLADRCQVRDVADKRYGLLRLERRYLRRLMLVGSVLAFAAVAAWLTFGLRPRSDESFWKDAVSIGTIDGFRRYLAEFPKGVHALHASARIVELQRQTADEDAWSAAVLKDTPTAFAQYVKASPTGPRVGEALVRAAALCKIRYPGAVSTVPPFNTISCRQGVAVLDNSCGPAKITKIVGGCRELGISRLTFCVSCEEGFDRLGVQTEKVTQDIAASTKLTTARGLLIIDLDKDGVAKAAGMRTGDVILAIDGVEIRESGELTKIVAESPSGKIADILMNRNGVEQTLSMVPVP